jgi:non-ribosomal peptide synthetase component F
LFEHDLFGKPVPTFPDHALAASLTLLYRRTRNRAVRAKHAAIACEGLKSLPAAFAVVKELAGVGRHGLNGLMTAVRASKR